jgi:hypothetical protein
VERPIGACIIPPSHLIEMFERRGHPQTHLRPHAPARRHRWPQQLS